MRTHAPARVVCNPSPFARGQTIMRDYPIKRPLDETACDHCGAPLRVGAIGVQREDDRAAVYCSDACADECAPDSWPAEGAGVSPGTAPEKRPAGRTRSARAT